ncbi:ASCH domain-containing protein (plasmid) [Aneurinibacillus sp. Ricciae_BoGa-3]|uniref:ASCH domain-containing protein n=1 Tax=Aneurinibacillus sp. Ricciae_BoGa-3 TaxID=3022697 RepID=UPI002341EC93|nr:ASCH domain-containing protein [Aneurinibacillus sp. Ricciae_BoGa-3]WCK57648.1 ASCH domain-containing protein [Aneurinibacillus sp. Ricciae_BoGa-3]
MKGLIVKLPWIDLILEGKKPWEIRGSHTTIRGKIALIKSGTGCVWGTVEVLDSRRLTEEEYQHSEHLHCIPNTDINPLPYKRIHAWVLGNPQPFKEPLPYQHPLGAVIWVNLS